MELECRILRDENKANYGEQAAQYLARQGPIKHKKKSTATEDILKSRVKQNFLPKKYLVSQERYGLLGNAKANKTVDRKRHLVQFHSINEAIQ